MFYSHGRQSANHHWSASGKGLLMRYLSHKKLPEGFACSWKGAYQYLPEISYYCQNLPPEQEFIFKSRSVESNSQHTKKGPSRVACKECRKPQPGKHLIPVVDKDFYSNPARQSLNLCSTQTKCRLFLRVIARGGISHMLALSTGSTGQQAIPDKSLL